MRYILPFTLILVMIYIFFHGLSKDPKIVPSNLINTESPDFSLTKISPYKNFDKKILIENNKEIKIVNFFASWCTPCAIEAPQLKYLSKSFKIYGVNKKDSKEKLQNFLNTYGNPFESIGGDPLGKASIEWGVYGLPETFILDKNGMIRYKHIGPIMKRDLSLFDSILHEIKNENNF